MKIASFAAVLLSGVVMTGAAYAQVTMIPMPAAPAPIAVGPPLAAKGLPQTPLTGTDSHFIREQLGSGMAEIKMAQLAIQKSQDQNVRNYAQKLITDHTAADGQLMQIADAYDIHPPAMLPAPAQAMYHKLSMLDGTAFDTVYINDMIHAHDVDIKQLDAHQLKGHSPQLNVWVQNTRPVVLQHDQIAQQIKANLPRTG